MLALFCYIQSSKNSVPLYAFFIIFSHEYHVDLCIELCSSDGLVVLHGTNINVEHYTQTFQPFCFIAAMLIGTLDIYYFTSLSLTLTLTGGHNVSSEQNLLVSFSRTLFNWSGRSMIWCWSNWSLLSWHHLTVNVFTRHLWISFVQIGLMIYSTELFILIQFCMTLSLIQSHWSVKKQKPCANYLTKLSVWVKSVYCWDMFVWQISYCLYLS